MTTPFIPAPDGSFIVGTIPGIQDITEATMKAALKLPVLPSFEAVQSNIVSEVKTPTSDLAAVVLTSTVINGQTVSRSVYNSSGTWTRPATPTGKRISRIAAAAINGGQGGNGPPSQNSDGAEGGLGGGYTLKAFVDGDVPSSVGVTVGAGGTGAGTGAIGAAGGTSSFGTLVIGKNGVANVLTAQGAIGSTCAPGNGGQGGGGGYNALAYEMQSRGLRGGSTALALGGDGGAVRTAGANGAASSSDPQIVSGGGGGGGGGGTSANNVLTAPAGSGGAGGAPGGGGGGAGGGQGSSTKFGGNGANGCVVVWTFFEDVIE